MYAFNYQRVSSLEEAVAAISANEEAKVLAGGQTLVASMKLRLIGPQEIVDLAGVPELRGISETKSGIRLGAMTRHVEVATSPLVKNRMPVLADLAGMIGDRMVRSMGTIGGSVANSDPAADYPAAVLGLNATVITNKREIAGDKFFTGMYETALDPGEIITSFAFTSPRRAAYVKFRNPASRFATVGVLVAQTHDGVRVAVTGARSFVFRAKDMEEALDKRFAPESVAAIHLSADDMNVDLHASSEYRAHLVTVIAQRAVALALTNSVAPAAEN